MPRGPYTRNACKTCKARHVKCDETYPACKKCTRTGRTCEGYGVDRSLSVEWFDSPSELQSYHYFCHETKPMLAGHYNLEFWDTLVGQIAASNQAIRHALSAVGDLHRGWNSTLSREPSSFSLQQCNKSIQLLMKEEMALVPSLLACILFACFNLLQNHLDSALEHLQSGLKILREWIQAREAQEGSPARQRDEDDMVERYFIPLFASYEAVVGNPTDDPHYRPFLQLYARDRRVLTAQSPHFNAYNSLEEARTHFHNLLDQVFGRLEKAIEEEADGTLVSQCIATGERLLRSWYRRLLIYLNTIARSKECQFIRAAGLLRIQYFVSLITLGTVTYRDEMRFDSYLDEFDSIVSLCAQIITMENVKDDGSPRVSLSFEYSVLTAMSLTIMRCRDPAIRSRAIRLMEGVHRHEGILGSGASVATWNLVVWLEQYGIAHVDSCRDIPSDRRIWVHSVDYEPGSFAREGSPQESSTGPPRWVFRWTTGLQYDGDLVAASFPIPTANTQREAFGTFPQGFDLMYGLEARQQEMCVAIKIRWDARSRSGKSSPST